MLRYKLRTLLILMAVVPPIIGWVWFNGYVASVGGGIAGLVLLLGLGAAFVLFVFGYT
jgi:hypothetical protein